MFRSLKEICGIDAPGFIGHEDGDGLEVKYISGGTDLHVAYFNRNASIEGILAAVQKYQSKLAAEQTEAK